MAPRLRSVSPSDASAVATALLLLVASVAAVPVVNARAPPTPVCGVCTVDRTTSGGTDVVAGESSLTVTLHDDGSTTWEARVELAAGNDALAANDSLRRTVVSEAARDGIADPVDIDARVDDGTLIVEYRDPGAAERRLGVVVFTPLTPSSPDRPFVSGGEGPRYLGADRLIVRGPPGHEVRGDADASVSDGNLVLTRDAVGFDDEGRAFVDVEADPVAVAAEAPLPSVRAWFARRLADDGR